MKGAPKRRPHAVGSADGIRVGLYARVSTADQQSIPDQLDQLRAYAALRGWTVALEVAEVGSGAKDRPGRRRLTEMARRRELDIIAVVRLDRWGRALGDLITSLDDLAALGVGFVALADSIDLTTPSGRALVGMLGVFAAFERDRTRERVAEGIAAAQARGVVFGRSPSISPATRAKVRDLIAAGRTKRSIAAELEISRDSVRRILADPDPDR